LLTGVVAVALAAPAAAQPQIIQTSCDTLSLNPVEVRMHFAVVNPDPRLVCKIRFIPKWDAEDSTAVCPVSDCSGPEFWGSYPSPHRAIWEYIPGPPEDEHRACVKQGETLDGFSVVMQGATCWYHAAFFEALMLQPFHWDFYYFDCGGAVQALTSTWGELKAIYR
jgi:hypothetical protein